MDIIVGNTGFVGSNLAAQHGFDACYHSTNIQAAYGAKPALCVYAGVPAEKYWANQNPQADRAVMEAAIRNISEIAPEKLVLISTIDVFENPVDVDENTPIAADGLQPYGANRFFLEEWVRENIADAHIIRLPGLFGKHIKKNFIYDLMHYLPSALTEEKYTQCAHAEAAVSRHYRKQADGFYRLAGIDAQERTALVEAFERIGFSALHFTDSRASFQFYNLQYLWAHIGVALAHDIRLLHLAVEPVGVGEIYQAVKGESFHNAFAQHVPRYDFKTIHAPLFGGKDGYIFGKRQVLREIQAFVQEESR